MVIFIIWQYYVQYSQDTSDYDLLWKPQKIWAIIILFMYSIFTPSSWLFITRNWLEVLKPNYMLYTTVVHLVPLIKHNLCVTHTCDICNMHCLFFYFIIINNNRQHLHANEQLQPLGKYVIHSLFPLCHNWAQRVKFGRSMWFSFPWLECCQLILNQIFFLFL